MEATEPVKVSERFNASDADIILVSSDKIHFKVHKANLIASSSVFADMFVVAQADSATEVPEIELVESGLELEMILPYVYTSEGVPPFNLDASEANAVIRSLFKYGLWYGITAVELAFSIQSWPCTRIYQGYSFGVLINSPSIKVRFLNQYLDFSPTLLDTKVLDDILDTLHANTRIELESEWSQRLLRVSDFYKTTSDALFFSNRGTHSHFKNNNKKEGHCVFRFRNLQPWSQLSGIISSKIMRSLMPSGAELDCHLCHQSLIDA